MATGVLIQARMGSTRLPGKVMMELLPNMTMLDIIVGRLKLCKSVDTIIVVTSDKSGDDVVVEWCIKNNTKFFRGDEKDVMNRYLTAALKFNITTIVRITADCPAIDSILVDKIVNFYKSNSYDYVSNTIYRTYPRGFDTEVFSTSALIIANELAILEAEREHVTPYIYGNINKFKVAPYVDNNNSKFRLTIDTKNDFEIAKKVFKFFKDKWQTFTYIDLINLYVQHPEWDTGDMDKQIKFESSMWYSIAKNLI